MLTLKPVGFLFLRDRFALQTTGHPDRGYDARSRLLSADGPMMHRLGLNPSSKPTIPAAIALDPREFLLKRTKFRTRLIALVDLFQKIKGPPIIADD